MQRVWTSRILEYVISNYQSNLTAQMQVFIPRLPEKPFTCDFRWQIYLRQYLVMVRIRCATLENSKKEPS